MNALQPEYRYRYTRRWSYICFLSMLFVIGGFGLSFLFPAVASAHAILIRSNPAQGAELSSPPTSIKMWFSETLNKTYTTAYVVNASDTAAQAQNVSSHVDNGAAAISSSDATEMDLTLKPNLPPAVYSVIYRTQSAADGHILNGSYVFTVKRADGSLPTYNGNGQSTSSLGSANGTGQLDTASTIGFLAISLVDLGAVFWVGAQLFRVFVLHLLTEEDAEQRSLLRRMEQRFDRVFSLPLLLVVLLANIAVLVGQAMDIVTGSLFQAFSPSLLIGLVSQGQFGLFWTVREGIVLLALVVALVLRARQKGESMNENVAWLNFILGLGLLCSITLSGHASAVNASLVVTSVLSDLLHLIAASLWIGGTLYISLVYLPVLQGQTARVRTLSLLTVLKRFSPLAFTGVVLMAVSGPLNATVRMNSWSQLIETAYGRTLLVKIVLVSAMLLVSAYHVFVVRPRLKRDYEQYHDTFTPASPADNNGEPGDGELLGTTDTKVLEQRVAQRSQYLTRVLSWEPILGVMVLLCTGLLGVFSGTLQSTASAPVSQTQPQLQVSKPYNSTFQTTDKLYSITLTIDPNRFGANTFTTVIHDSHGAAVSPDKIGVSLYTTMLDMDMGTQEINLQPNKQGNFSAQDDLSMEGHWEVRVSITSQDNKLHNATVDLQTPTPAK